MHSPGYSKDFRELHHYSLCQRWGKNLNKTIKIDVVLSAVEVGSNGLSEAHSGVELCVSDLGRAGHTMGYYTNATRGAVSNSPGKKEKKKKKINDLEKQS